MAPCNHKVVVTELDAGSISFPIAHKPNLYISLVIVAHILQGITV
jgi:hypothetical protein